MKGLVVYLDVLGYKNLLGNNLLTESIEEILDVIINTPKKSFFLNKLLLDTEHPEIDGLIQRIKHLVFSDTIVVTLEYPDDADSEWIDFAISIMMGNAAHMAVELFNHGLPIRGVIHEGEFLVKENCIAGEGMLEANRLCEQLDFSGVVFSRSLSKRMIDNELIDNELIDNELIDNELIDNDTWPTFTYLAPMKGGKEERLVLVDWFYFAGIKSKERCQANPESFVLESFWAHKKDCPSSVDVKVKNTVKLIRKMIHNSQLNVKQKLPANFSTQSAEVCLSQAEEFFSKVFQHFGVRCFTTPSIVDFEKILSEKNWYEFLAATDDFKISIDSDDSDGGKLRISLLCPASRRGLIIKPERRPDFVKYLADIEMKFASFSQLNTINQKEVISKFLKEQ